MTDSSADNGAPRDETLDQPQGAPMDVQPEAPLDGPPDAPADAPADPSADPTPRRRPRPTGPIQYKGEELVPERGPGLGCFRIQLVVLAFFIVLTPLSVTWDWPSAVSAGLLFAVLVLLLFTGQTIIFLLRLVAADRRGPRRPLASDTKTVGELEDEHEGGSRVVAPPESPAEVAGESPAQIPPEPPIER